MLRSVSFNIRSLLYGRTQYFQCQPIKYKGSVADLYGTATAWKSEKDFRKEITAKSNDEFTGYIPTEELEFKYSRSSGPGGQHVNKINSKVEARFQVETANWIPEEIKPRLIESEQSRITRDGYLIVTSEKTRKQVMNQADVLSKIRKMVFDASVISRVTTEEDLKILKEREDKAKEANIRFKRQRAMKRGYHKNSVHDFR